MVNLQMAARVLVNLRSIALEVLPWSVGYSLVIFTSLCNKRCLNKGYCDTGKHISGDLPLSASIPFKSLLSKNSEEQCYSNFGGNKSFH